RDGTAAFGGICEMAGATGAAAQDCAAPDPAIDGGCGGDCAAGRAAVAGGAGAAGPLEDRSAQPPHDAHDCEPGDPAIDSGACATGGVRRAEPDADDFGP